MGFAKDKILRLAKGFRGRNKNCIKQARLRVEKALQHAYISRKVKKREFRGIWITKINAATREHGLAYSTFINGLQKQNVWLNRKVLSELAATEPYSFKALVDQVKFMQGKRTPRSKAVETSVVDRVLKA